MVLIMSGSDHRASPRADITIWVEEHRPLGITFHHTGNISPTGVYFEGTLPHPLGTVVTLRFTLPNREAPIETQGEVVRSLLKQDRPGMAIRFTSLKPGDAEAISQLVDGVNSSRP